MSDPIQDSSELHEAEEGDDEFVVARCHAAEAFDATEEVFNAVAQTVVAAIKGRRPVAIPPRGDADACSLVAQPCANIFRIEALAATTHLRRSAGSNG